MTTTTSGLVPVTATKIAYTAVQALVAGANVINHGLGIVTPFAQIVAVRDATTGQEIVARVTAMATNSCTVTVTTAVANARVTVVGG